MTKDLFRCLLALVAVAALASCTPKSPADSSVLTCTAWSGYESFWNLAEDAGIELERDTYAGANRTDYSWIQMQAGETSDIFITSQILDENLAKENLVDLSGYDLINDFPTAILNQVSIDGGVYLLPVNYSMYGILYNKTLMEEHGWETPENF